MYIVALTGGLEEPSFKAFGDRIEALDTFSVWSEGFVGAPGDRVDLIAIDSNNHAAVIDYFIYDDEEDN